MITQLKVRPANLWIAHAVKKTPNAIFQGDIVGFVAFQSYRRLTPPMYKPPFGDVPTLVGWMNGQKGEGIPAFPIFRLKSTLCSDNGNKQTAVAVRCP